MAFIAVVAFTRVLLIVYNVSFCVCNIYPLLILSVCPLVKNSYAHLTMQINCAHMMDFLVEKDEENKYIVVTLDDFLI